MSRRVVVTGLGALTPIGNNVSDFWNNLLKGTSGAGPITRFDATHFKTRFACEVNTLTQRNFWTERRRASSICMPFTQW